MLAVVDHVGEVLAGRLQGVDGLLWRLDRLRARDVVRFDAELRAAVAPGAAAPARLATVVALTSADGHERQRAVESVRTDAPDDIVANLLVVRAVDWVEPVRAAALAKLRELPPLTRLYVLPMVERLRSRARGGPLVALFAELVEPDALRITAAPWGHPDPLSRRCAWRLLHDERELWVDEVVHQLAVDRDASVRALAAEAIDVVISNESDHERRRVAIKAALLCRDAGVRRSAREWAALDRLDADGFYSGLFGGPPAFALAESATIATVEARLHDRSPRVSAAALRALARLSPHAARDEARALLLQPSSRRVARAAARVLRAAGLDDVDRAELAAAAAEPGRPAADRQRLLRLLARDRALGPDDS